jgi:hypothetical protein
MRYAKTDSRRLLAAALVVLASGATAQTAQELIDLDMTIAVEKRNAELAKLRQEQSGPPSRPLVTADPPKPRPEEQFHVRGVYGPVDALRALVSYLDSVPVELSLAPNGERDLAGWRLSSLDTRRLVFERTVLGPPPKGKRANAAQPEWITERVSLPIRVQALPAAPAPFPVVAPTGNATPYIPMPLPAGVVPMVPGKPQ